MFSSSGRGKRAADAELGGKQAGPLESANYVFLVRQGEKGHGLQIRVVSRRGCWDPEIMFSTSGRGKRAADAELDQGVNLIP